MKDQVTALVADIMRQAEEQGQVISQESAEEYAMREVFATRRDWEVGIGPSIPRSSMGMARALDKCSKSSSSRTNPLVSEMQSTLSSQQAQMEDQQAEQHEMRQQIAFLTRMSQKSPTTPQPQPTSQPGATTN